MFKPRTAVVAKLGWTQLDHGNTESSAENVMVSQKFEIQRYTNPASTDSNSAQIK